MFKRALVSLARNASYDVLVPLAYWRAATQPVDPRKVVFVIEKGDTIPSAYSVMLPYLRDVIGMDVRVHIIGFNEGIGRAEHLRRSMALARAAATASVVFLDDASREISCLPLRPETRVVQLWHACGAFKKWGASTEGLRFGHTLKQVKRHPFYANLSLVTVSSPEVEWAYREAMLLEESPEVVQPLGVSRTDVFFDDAFIEQSFHSLYEQVPQAMGKRVLLYAPTFRGDIEGAEAPDALDIAQLASELGEDWVLLINHHPFVKSRPVIPAGYESFAFDVTGELPINQLLTTADALVTDYSSVVFEYSLTNRPICFFAYDLEDYDDWRGFYYPYEEMTPGPVVRTTAEVAAFVRDTATAFDDTEVRTFRNRFMSSCDGHSTQRIWQAISSL
jgi:CDP-ribitol ribitolphosphotransferase